MIGVKKGVVSNWERGISKPDVNKLALLCRALNASFSYLLDYHENTAKPVMSIDATRIGVAFDRAPDNICRAIKAMLEPYMTEVAANAPVVVSVDNDERQIRELQDMVKDQYEIEKKVGVRPEALSFVGSSSA